MGNKNLFVGRQLELEALERLRNKKTASLVIVKGRRRIGKSRLIEEFASNTNFYEFSGLAPEKNITQKQQWLHFFYQLKYQSGLKDLALATGDWNDLFMSLANITKGKKVIILFDEISWMGSKDPTFLGKLKTAWDIYFKKNPELILILCGSVSSWIETNILRSKLFMGRVSLPLTIQELSIPESNQLLQKTGCKFSQIEKFKLLAVMGGIPRYLEEIHPELSADENIKNLCFVPNGMLVSEFKDIFTDIFSSRSNIYKKIVSTLVTGNHDIAFISQAIKISRGSHLSECLEALNIAGIICRHHTWSIATGKDSNLSQFRLKDNYIRFYLKYIENNLGKILEGHYQYLNLSSFPGWATIMGLQFENLVLNNRTFILKQLNINQENIINDNPFFQRKTQRQAGCQIDYLIQTRENTLFACEVKFSKHEIKPDVINEMTEKVNRLNCPPNYTVLPVLIYINGIHELIEDRDYFYKTIDFSQLLH